MSADLDAFAERAEFLGCTVVHADTIEDARQAVLDIMGGRPALVDDTVLGDLGADVGDDPWSVLVGVSEAFAASAQSGTVALVHGAGAPRRTAALPDHHVIVVPVGVLKPTYQEMVDAVAALDPIPAGVQFVTGASRSGDIESAMVKGMHGPRQVTIVLIRA